MLGIAEREFEQFAFIAALRNHETHIGKFGIGYHRHHHIFQRQIESLTEFVDCYRHEFFVGFIESNLILYGKSFHYGAVAHMHKIDKRSILVAQQRKYVDIMNLLTHHFALGAIFLDELIFLLQHLCFLEAQLLRESHHFVHEMLGEFASVAVENLLHTLYIFGILLLAHQSATTAFTIMNVILQTERNFGALYSVLVDGMAASAQGIDFANHIYHHMRHIAMGIGAEASRTARRLVASDEHARIVLIGDANPGIGFIVLEQHIVVRLVFLDKTVFEVKRIFFGSHHGVLHIVDVSHQYVGASHRVNPIEIAIHAALQILGFTHIYYHPIAVVITIHSGAFGQQTYLQFQFFAWHHHLY